MTKRYGDGMDDNALISHIVDQLLLIDSRERLHEEILDEWLVSLGDGSSLTERERAAVLTRFMAVTL